MKHFTLDWLINKYDVPQDRRPAPFKGKWPTRVAYRIWVVGRKEPVEYCGNPSPSAMARFMKYVRPQVPKINWIYFEFDQAGIIARIRMDKKVEMNRTAWSCYHPLGGQSDPAQDFKQPFFRKKISSWTVYSPFKTLKLAQLSAVKELLVIRGIISPGPIKKAPAKKKKVVGYAKLAVCGRCTRAFNRTVQEAISGSLCPYCGAYIAPNAEQI